MAVPHNDSASHNGSSSSVDLRVRPVYHKPFHLSGRPILYPAEERVLQVCAETLCNQESVFFGCQLRYHICHSAACGLELTGMELMVESPPRR